MSTWAKCTHCLLLVQHNSQIADGVSGLTSALEAMGKQGITMVYSKTHQVLAHGDFALAVSEGTFAGKPPVVAVCFNLIKRKNTVFRNKSGVFLLAKYFQAA